MNYENQNPLSELAKEFEDNKKETDELINSVIKIGNLLIDVNYQLVKKQSCLEGRFLDYDDTIIARLKERISDGELNSSDVFAFRNGAKAWKGFKSLA